MINIFTRNRGRATYETVVQFKPVSESDTNVEDIETAMSVLSRWRDKDANPLSDIALLTFREALEVALEAGCEMELVLPAVPRIGVMQ